MKKIIATLIMGSLSTLAFGQSMLVMKTGKVLTIDRQGMVFDLGNFFLPYEIKKMGGRFFIDNKRKLTTVDRNGFMYSKEDERKAPINIEHMGDNYIISKWGKIYTIDEQGYYFVLDKEKEFRKVDIKGGIFFTAEKKIEGEKSKTIYTVDHSGVVTEVKYSGLNPDFINFAGGQYFTTTRGELFTVSVDGSIYSKKSMGHFNGWEFKRGGNYFIYRGEIYTIAENGILSNMGAIANYGLITKMGTNFFTTINGKLFTISGSGSIQEADLGVPVSNISHFSHL